MSNLRELYQQVILDHNRSPKNFRAIEPCAHEADGFNPLCGDKVHIYVAVEDDKITDIAFQGEGCAISTAAASMMTQALTGKTLAEAQAIFENYQKMVMGEDGDVSALGKLAVFEGVREFPMRVKCATLAWHTMKAALEGKTDAATTE
ncbi:MAG: Fe-S cluster assembly sulfur transfer protein SufU [Planctomycetota bacterium]